MAIVTSGTADGADEIIRSQKNWVESHKLVRTVAHRLVCRPYRNRRYALRLKNLPTIIRGLVHHADYGLYTNEFAQISYNIFKVSPPLALHLQNLISLAGPNWVGGRPPGLWGRKLECAGLTLGLQFNWTPLPAEETFSNAFSLPVLKWIWSHRGAIEPFKMKMVQYPSQPCQAILKFWRGVFADLEFTSLDEAVQCDCNWFVADRNPTKHGLLTFERADVEAEEEERKETVALVIQTTRRYMVLSSR
ncbi:hypothetical protein BC828DRAFT_438348 [Blastocladiella britannica]|nr:hypothetical protein BC828DRAFT_438348 [Blastocladiella britannica]